MEITNAINKVMEQERAKSPRLVIRSEANKWTVRMPYRHKFTEKELTYLKQYGLEDFMNWQYSLYEEKIWTLVLKKVKSLITPSIDDWQLHDDYIYEQVEIEEPDEGMTSQYLKRFKKMGIIDR